MNWDDAEIPEGWAISPLGDVIQPSRLKVDPASVPDMPYIGLEHVEAHTTRLLGRGTAADVKSAKSVFKAGDVLYGKLRPYLNKVVRPDFDGVCSTDFLVFGESERLERSYLAHYLNQLWVADRAHHLSAGVELPRVDWGSLSTIPIAYPRSKELQGAILTGIEASTAKGRSAAEHLTSARRTIERFRQAVLAAACSGRLTADWRAANPETPSVEHALAALLATKRRRPTSEQPVDISMPELPDSYIVAPLGDAATILEYGTSQRADASAESGVPVLRMGNIQEGQLDLRDLKYCSPDAEIERLLLEDGDLLFNRTNSPELVGKTAVFHETVPMSFASYLIRVRFAPAVVLPDFVNYWINSAWGRVWARQVKTDGVSQSNINGTKLSLMPLPLPPIDEQKVIVERTSQLLVTADRLTQAIETATRKVERSSQAVLAKAFRGELITSQNGGTTAS